VPKIQNETRSIFSHPETELLEHSYASAPARLRRVIAGACGTPDSATTETNGAPTISAAITAREQHRHMNFLPGVPSRG
jgi:hypothetical protein